MANQPEMDFEKKFQEDLEKATALSLESLALDQYRRSKLQYSHSDISVSKRLTPNQRERTNVANASTTTSSNQSRLRPSSIKTGGSIDYDLQSPLGPPPTVPPRRHSEIHLPDKSTNRTEESDLISFTSPTAKKDENIDFDNLIEEIQRLNVSHSQTSNVQPNFAGFQQNAPGIAGNHLNQHGLQLVPYNNQQLQQQQAHKAPLTTEQLQKLYSMHPQPYCHPHLHQQTHQMRPFVQAQSAPPITASPFTYSPVIGSYGFNPNVFPAAAQTQTPPPQSVAALQFPNVQMVANPDTALVQTKTSEQHQTASTSSNQIPRQISQIPKSASLSGVSSITSVSSKHINKSTSSNNASGNGNVEIARRPKKSLCDDLIDLGHEDNSRVSVLEAFDPLLSKEWNDSDNSSDCATSYYSEYDPFDYLYSCGTQYSDPVYEAVNKTDRTPMSPGAPIGWNIPALDSAYISPTASTSKDDRDKTIPPPLPPRNSYATRQQQTNQVLDRRKGATKLYEIITDRKSHDDELMEFYYMVRDLRRQYKYTDARTNIGHVIAAEFDYSYSSATSIKLVVHPSLEALKRTEDAANQGQISGYGAPVQFTCDISTTVEHVTMHAFCELEGHIIGSVNDFMLKPIDVVEWLSPTSKLSQLECVHASIKLEQDVQLGLCLKTEANMKAIARTVADDTRDMALKPEDILPNEHMSTTTFDNMMILIETLETEIDKLESVVSDSHAHTIISCSGVVQGIKAICAVLGSIDTLEICEYVEELKTICNMGRVVYTYNSPSSPDIVSESGDYAEVMLRPKSTLDQIKLKCNYLREAIQQLIETYANAFRVDFCVNSIDYATTPIQISCVLKPIMVNISCLHRPPPNWKFDDYMLGAQINHGTRYISQPVVTPCSNDTTGGLFPRLKFDTWITFESNPICTLPRESRLIFVLYGCRAEPAEGSEQSSDNNQERKKITTELGWCAVQLFDFQSNMIFGTYLLSLWPPTTDKFLGPAPPKGSHPQPDFCPVLSIEVPSYGGRIIFPDPPPNPEPAPRYDFSSLDHNLQQELRDTAEQGYSGTLEKREVLWEKRHYLQAFPHALPKVLHAAHSWDYASLIDLHSLLNSWTPLAPLQSIELLLPRYPDMEVRKKAVKWVSRLRNDQIVDFLPQLVQALKHDTYDASPMAQFLLCKSLESPRIAHHLYWLLVHSLPGDAPQNSIDGMTTGETDDGLITQTRYHRRNKMMLRAILAICGEKLSSRFLSQNMMCKSLAETAQNVKQAKESMRQKTLIQGLETVNQILLESSTSLPLDPALEVYGVNSRNSSFFNSFTLPLKVSFLGPDRGILPAIFKCGDDLQQDMLTIQLVRIMDKLWLAEGLDLKMVTFNCVPTSYKKGMIELVTDAETLRKIQVEYGLTGSFKDRPIAEWLARQNPSQLEYKRAVDNFTYSCAGYSVATYVLGICDRHNDNIMLKTSGHLFHIDFGKFLGDAQMFGNFKRDRTPFVLTSDMAYVINGGDKPSTAFHNFVDLCCKAFNIVRKHGDLLLHMLALMASAGIPGVTADAVTYVRRALLPSQSNPEAAASFAKMIQFSLKSWFTQFNFFLHNLAQMRFTNDEGSGELLSFIPRTYTMKQDGRLKSVTVVNYQKRYDLEKYYTYILKVTRHGQPDPSYLFRSYKEFSEFHQKLCLHYPLVKLHSLPSGIHVGRSNIKTVAERRLPEIRKFLISLFLSADEIAHSDLVYTFFHPILRDQQEADINVPKVKVVPSLNPTEPICGEIKLSLQYRRGALTVMIHHARGLAKLAGGQEPNTYVKCYLRPDPTKATKRKTKVVRKTCVPSFMETLEYRMPIEHIRNRTLEVTVWSHDTLQENVLLGGYQLSLAELDLREEVMQWCRLGYLPRSKRDAPQ